MDSEIALVADETRYEIALQVFRWSAFIAEEYASADFCGEGIGGGYVFGGDNRSWEPELIAPSARVAITTHFAFLAPEFGPAPDFELTGWEDPYISTLPQIGETTLYEQHDDGTVELVDTDTAPSSDIEVTGRSITANVGRMNIDIGSSNPLCHIFNVDAPEIDIEADVELWRDGTLYATGTFDRAPHHEAYVHTQYKVVEPEPTYPTWRFEGFQIDECLVNHENDGFFLLPFPGIPFDFNPSDEGQPATC